MVSIKAITVTAITFIGAVSGTSLHVNTGCIIANGNALCAGNPPLYVNGEVEVYACIGSNSDGAYSTCHFEGNIPTAWNDAYWGGDNCLYSAGSSPILVGCSSTTSLTPVPNPY